MAIPGFDNLSVWGVAKRSVKDFMDDDMSTYAAALTYRVLLAIFPFLLFLLTLLGALGIQNFFDWLLEQAQSAFPDDLYSMVERIVNQVQGGANGGLLSIGLLTALWAASGGIRSAMHALNVAYDVKEERPIWKKYPLSLVFTIGLAVLLIAAVALMFLGPQVVEGIAEPLGLGDAFVAAWTWLRIPVAILLMMVALAVIYYFFPNVDQPFQFVSPGSVIAVLAWILATIGFAFYINNFANYNATYGSLGGVIILLLYIYISSAVLLLGAEINGVIYKATHGAEEENVDEGAAAEAQREAQPA